MSRERLRWYLLLLAGLVPVLVVGFATSALANRIAFLGWALVVASGYAAGLRLGIARGWGRLRLQGALLLWLALGAAAYGGLVARSAEVFDLGFRALAPGLYGPWLVRPAAPEVLALLLALFGLADLALDRRRRLS